jgi:hypothetical protein
MNPVFPMKTKSRSRLPSTHIDGKKTMESTE